MNSIAFSAAVPADRPSSPYLSVPNGANDPYGFLNDLATATLAQELGGTPVYQSGKQSGSGPCSMPNWNQIRLGDGTLIGAGAAQYNIDLVGLDRYKEQLAALQAANASTGYTDPALNTPESERYAAVQAALGPVLAPPVDPAGAPEPAVKPPDPAAARVTAPDPLAAPFAAQPDQPGRESLLSYAYSALGEAAQRLGIEK